MTFENKSMTRFGLVWFIVFNAVFNNISVISWWSVLLVEHPEKTTNLPQVTDTLHHIMLYRVHFAWSGFELTTLVMIGIDCIGSYISNYMYHTITTTTAPITHTFIFAMATPLYISWKTYIYNYNSDWKSHWEINVIRNCSPGSSSWEIINISAKFNLFNWL
jgi:hypothetical protein